MRLEAAHAAAPALLALVRDDELPCRSARRRCSRRARRRARRCRRSGGARRCSRLPRRRTARSAPAARGRGAGTRARTTRPIAEKLFMSVTPRPYSRSSVDASRRTDRCPTAGRRPARRRCARTARCRRCVALPSRAGSVANRLALRRSSSNVSVDSTPWPVEVVAHPVDQREIGIAARRVEADQRADEIERAQVLGARGVAAGATCGKRGGGVHVATPPATQRAEDSTGNTLPTARRGQRAVRVADVARPARSPVDGHSGRADERDTATRPPATWRRVRRAVGGRSTTDGGVSDRRRDGYGDRGAPRGDGVATTGGTAPRTDTARAQARMTGRPVRPPARTPGGAMTTGR